MDAVEGHLQFTAEQLQAILDAMGSANMPAWTGSVGEVEVQNINQYMLDNNVHLPISTIFDIPNPNQWPQPHIAALFTGIEQKLTEIRTSMDNMASMGGGQSDIKQELQNTNGHLAGMSGYLASMHTSVEGVDESIEALRVTAEKGVQAIVDAITLTDPTRSLTPSEQTQNAAEKVVNALRRKPELLDAVINMLRSPP